MSVVDKVMTRFRCWRRPLMVVVIAAAASFGCAPRDKLPMEGDRAKEGVATTATAPTSDPPKPVAKPVRAQRSTRAYPPTPMAEEPQVLKVGPERRFKVPSQAARFARDGDVIEIDAGDYLGDVAVWRANRLILRGVGGRPRLRAEGNAAEAKAIWVIKGDDVTVEAIEFSGARVPDKNGAGIRSEGTNLTIRRSAFFDNEMGVLTGHDPNSKVLIEFSEFARNTVDYRKYGRLGHNIYIGNIKRFVLRGSYVHGAVIGHNVKTRAASNFILFNRIMDGNDGGSSYLIDFAHGGDAYVIGNLFHQSPRNDNHVLVAYATERGRDDSGRNLYVVNNTFVNDFDTGSFVGNSGTTPASVMNNIAVGPGTLLSGPGEARGNVVGDDAGFVDRAAFDYRLTSDSPAIDAGVDPGSAGGMPLAPAYEYVQPLELRPRQRVGPLDAGAHEFSGPGEDKPQS